LVEQNVLNDYNFYNANRTNEEVLGTPNAEMRKNLTGDQPKLFTPWLAMNEEMAS
jgi:hypothetical protein